MLEIQGRIQVFVRAGEFFQKRGHSLNYRSRQRGCREKKLVVWGRCCEPPGEIIDFMISKRLEMAFLATRKGKSLCFKEKVVTLE